MELSKKFISLIKRNWPLLIILLISIFIYKNWLSFDIFSNEDYWFQFSETAKSFLHYSFWQSDKYAGYTSVTFNMLFFNFFPGFFGYFGFDSNIYDKFLLFWPFIFITPISSFFLSKKILKNNIASFISSLVYCFNTYFLAINTQGHLSLTLAASFAPLALLFFIEALDKKSFSFSFLTTIFLFIVGSYDFRVFYIEIFIIFFYFIFHILIIEQQNRDLIYKSILIFLAMAISISLLNIYWMLPMAKIGTLTENLATSRDLVPFSLDIKKSLTLFHPFWNGEKPIWFKEQSIPIYFWLIPTFAIFGFWFGRKNKKIIFFSLIAILSIILAKQDASPFGGFYIWLFEKFPGFNAFREASKFYFAIILSYSILIGSFINWIWENWKKNNFLICAKYFLTIVIAGIFLWNTQSIITGKIKTIHIPKEILKEELNLREFIKNQPDFFRTLWIPSEPRWISFDNNHPKMNATEMKRREWKNFSENLNQGGNWETKDRLIYVLNQPFSKNLISNNSIKYIFIENNEKFSNELEKIEYLEKVKFEAKNSLIFENKYPKPHLYLTKEKETIHRDVDFYNIDFKYLDPSHYEIEFKNVKDPFYLNFSENFHPEWKLRLGNLNWFSAIIDKNYFLDEKYHFKNDSLLNSYFLKPEEICKNHSCQKNKDGTFNFRINLFFKPQGYVYLGLSIMIPTFIFIFLYLVYSLIKYLNLKK